MSSCKNSIEDKRTKTEWFRQREREIRKRKERKSVEFEIADQRYWCSQLIFLLSYCCKCRLMFDELFVYVRCDCSWWNALFRGLLALYEAPWRVSYKSIDIKIKIVRHTCNTYLDIEQLRFYVPLLIRDGNSWPWNMTYRMRILINSWVRSAMLEWLSSDGQFTVRRYFFVWLLKIVWICFNCSALSIRTNILRLIIIIMQS